MRRGTTCEGSACGNDSMGQLGMQRIAVGGLAMLMLLHHGSSSEDGASDNSGLLLWQTKLRVCIMQRVVVDPRVWFGCLMEILETGQHDASS